MALQIAALNDPTRGSGRHGSAAARAAARRTTEAEEARLTSKYEHALLFMRDGALEDAERELRSILDHDMMSGPPNHRPVEEYPAPAPKPQRDAEDSDTDDNSAYESEDDTPEMTLTSTMTQVKFLALKNLGRLVADRAERREKESRRDDDDDTRANLDADFALALRCYAAAVEIDGTDASLWRRLGSLAASRRLPHVARHALERGLAIAPTHPLMLEDLAETLLAVGDLDACAHVAELLRKVDPGHARAARMRDDPGGLTPLAKFSRSTFSSSPASSVAPSSTDERKDLDGAEITLRVAEKSWESVARVLNAAMGSAPPEDYNNEDAGADLMDVGILRLFRERVPEFKTQWPDMSLRYRNRERDPTTWQGVRFDGPGMGNSDDRLIKLVVVGRGEQGTLTAAALEPELGKLDALRHLELRNCALTVAPPSISKLTALTYLDLGKNRLMYVPDISELINLQVLILSDNDLMELPKLPIPPDDSDEDTALRHVEISGNPRLAQHMTPATVKYLFDHLPRIRKIKMVMAEESQVRARHAHDVESQALVGNVAKALAARGFAGGNQPGTQTPPGTTPATAPPANQNLNQQLAVQNQPMDVEARGPSTPNRGEDGDGLGSDDDDTAGDGVAPVDVLDVLGRVVRFVVPVIGEGSEHPGADAWKDVEAPTEADWARVSRAHADKVRREREWRERAEAEREAAIETAKQEAEARRIAEEEKRRAQAAEEERVRQEEEERAKAEEEEAARRREKEAEEAANKPKVVIKYGKEIKLEPARRSRRQIEAEEREALEKIAREEEERLAAEAAVAAQIAAERSKWEPMTDVGATLAAAAVGDDGSLVAGAGATCLAMAAAAPMARGDDDAGAEAAAREKAAAAAAAEKAAADARAAEAAEEAEEAEERDEEEEADVASFLASVSSRNSGAADVAWRLLARVTERWRPSSEGAMRELAADTDGGKNDDGGGKNAGKKGARSRGSFGLRHAPRPATLLRLAETFGPGPEGGDPNHKSRMARVHLCLADAATRASVVAAAVARARLAARRRRVPAGGQPVLSKAAAAAATEATEGLPPSHFLDAARTHLSKAVAAAKDDDAVFLAEYHFVAGSLAATETGGSITLAEEHLQAAMDCARAAEESVRLLFFIFVLAIRLTSRFVHREPTPRIPADTRGSPSPTYSPPWPTRGFTRWWTRRTRSSRRVTRASSWRRSRRCSSRRRRSTSGRRRRRRSPTRQARRILSSRWSP